MESQSCRLEISDLAQTFHVIEAVTGGMRNEVPSLDYPSGWSPSKNRIQVS